MKIKTYEGLYQDFNIFMPKKYNELIAFTIAKSLLDNGTWNILGSGKNKLFYSLEKVYFFNSGRIVAHVRVWNNYNDIVFINKYEYNHGLKKWEKK